jgi:hypothetical protein
MNRVCVISCVQRRSHGNQGGPGSQAHLSSDLRACKRIATDAMVPDLAPDHF